MLCPVSLEVRTKNQKNNGNLSVVDLLGTMYALSRKSCFTLCRDRLVISHVLLIVA